MRMVRTHIKRIQAADNYQISAEEIIFRNQGLNRVVINKALHIEAGQSFTLSYMQGCRDESYFDIAFEGVETNDLIVVTRQIENP